METRQKCSHKTKTSTWTLNAISMLTCIRCTLFKLMHRIANFYADTLYANCWIWPSVEHTANENTHTRHDNMKARSQWRTQAQNKNKHMASKTNHGPCAKQDEHADEHLQSWARCGMHNQWYDTFKIHVNPYQVYALTTHQLQVERRERVIETIKCTRSPPHQLQVGGERRES